MKLSPIKKIYISIAVFLVVFLAIAFFVILPIVQSIQGDSRELSMIKKAQSTFSKEKETFQKFEEVYKLLETDLEKTENIFVNSEVPINFIDFLEKTAYDSNILVEIFSVDLIKDKKDTWSSLSFQLEIFGSFPDCLRFLEKLENSTYLIDVQGLSIGRLDEDSLESQKLSRFFIGDISTKISLKVFAK